MTLDEIRKLIDEATPAEKWEAVASGSEDGRFDYATGPWHDNTLGKDNHAQTVADTRLIAASRTLLPKLLRGIDTLFDAIKHGDGEHQAWLEQKIEAHFRAALEADA